MAKAQKSFGRIARVFGVAENLQFAPAGNLAADFRHVVLLVGQLNVAHSSARCRIRCMRRRSKVPVIHAGVVLDLKLVKWDGRMTFLEYA
jgi:hypothetical protein